MSAWKGICEKVEAGERLGTEDGIYLFEKAELNRLGQLEMDCARQAAESFCKSFR